MVREIFSGLFARPVAKAPEFRRFLSGEASYLAQRTTYEFSRNTLAWYGQHYFVDPGFVTAFAKCRWESFGLLAADMTVLAYGRMLQTVRDDPDALRARMRKVYAAVLGEYPLPEHRPHGWGDLCERQAAQLADFQPPGDPASLVAATAKPLFGGLPVFSENRRGDYEVVANAIRFGLVAFHDRLCRRVAFEPVARALLADVPLEGAAAVPAA